MKPNHNIHALLLFSTLFLLINQYSFSQAQPLYSQFVFNKSIFNPAVAGSEQTGALHLSAYEQWIGFAGAPKFYNVSFDSRLFKKVKKPKRTILKNTKLLKPENIGFGGQVFNEQYGPLCHTGFIGTYSYHLKLKNQQLSFGLSSGLSNLGLKSSDVRLSDEFPDLLLYGDNARRWILDFDFGLFLRSSEYFVGYSLTHISRSAIQWGGSANTDYRQDRLHYFMGGYKFTLSRNLYVEPVTLVKLAENQKDQFDISLIITLHNDYWFGTSYKTSNTLSFFGGLQYDRYQFCYSFDYSLSSIRTYSMGSHEIHLAIRFGDQTSRYRWLKTN